MPYKSFKDVNPALKGIKPKITLSQANLIAKWADAMERAEDGPESAWAAAIAQFKKLYRVEGGKWVKRKVKESSMSEYKAYTTSTNSVLIPVNAINVDGETVPVAELVAAYKVGAAMKEGESADSQITEETLEIGENVSGSLEDYASCVKDAFRSAFGRRGSDGYVESPYVRDVFKDDPDLGDSVVVRDAGKMYAVDYVEEEDGFSFADRGKWQEVVLTYKKVGSVEEMAEAELCENVTFDAFMPEGDHSAAILEVVKEAGVTAGEGRRAPVVVDLQIIKPGPGNKRDNRYYPSSTLKNYAHVFESADIFVTDHKARERSEKTKVGRVKKCPIRFTEENAPVGRTIVYDPDTAEKIRNRADANELDTLHCSILGTGNVRPGEVDGKKYDIVESINDRPLVEFVSKAGAGGHALNLAENNAGGVNMDKEKITELLSESELPPEAQERLAGAEYEDEGAVKEAILQEKEQAQREEAPQKLEEAEVEKLLSETNLSIVSRKRLAEGEYEDESALREAIMAEVEYVKKLTGSGQPFAQGGGTAPGEEQMSEADYETAYADILRRHGLYVPQQEVSNV